MHYQVIDKAYDHTYKGCTRRMTWWDVVITRDNGTTYTQSHGGRLCLERALRKLDQEIAAAEAQRQAQLKAQAKERAATLKKKPYITWWGCKVNR